MKIHDALERTVWTFVQAFFGALVIRPATSVGATFQAALFAGASAVVAMLSVFARTRLSALPNPGDGLPCYRAPGGPTIAPAPQPVTAAPMAVDDRSVRPGTS